MQHSTSQEQTQEMPTDMAYEYTLKIGIDDRVAFAFRTSKGATRFGPLSHAQWWQDREEVSGLLDELKALNPYATAHVVRRLVSAPEKDE